MVMLKIDSIDFYYGTKKVLEKISFDADDGDIIGIIGPNGSGKTTMLRVISAIQKPRSGSIFLDGTDIFKLKQKELLCSER